MIQTRFPPIQDSITAERIHKMLELRPPDAACGMSGRRSSMRGNRATVRTEVVGAGTSPGTPVTFLVHERRAIGGVEASAVETNDKVAPVVGSSRIRKEFDSL